MKQRVWVRLLSPAQWTWALAALLACAALIAVGLATGTTRSALESGPFTPDMSLKEVAPQLDVTGKALARELGLPLDAPKSAPLKTLGVTQEHLDEAVEHLLGHRDTSLKYWLYAALVVWGWIFLTRLGRPERSSRRERRSWYPRLAYTLPLLAAVVVAGFVLGKSPNPMEAAVKVFKSMVGLYPDVWAKVVAFLFFLGLAVVGNKLICGWACPFGAAQELLHSLPWLKKLKRKAKPPFWIMNAIRAGLFLLMLLLLFGLVGGRKGFVVYHDLNPFNLFALEFDTLPVLVTVVASLLLALIVYRPYCYLICPFGLLSWIAERASIHRVRIDREKCNDCGACVRACPSHAAEGILRGDALRADCFSCARCLSACPTDAIRYGARRRRSA